MVKVGNIFMESINNKITRLNLTPLLVYMEPPLPSYDSKEYNNILKIILWPISQCPTTMIRAVFIWAKFLNSHIIWAELIWAPINSNTSFGRVIYLIVLCWISLNQIFARRRKTQQIIWYVGKYLSTSCIMSEHFQIGIQFVNI